jgi:hypothetical protein
MKNGIIYQGPSLLDGAPIVVIANYSKSNRKTGGVVQTYILRADMNPLEASKTGADFSICGDCKHKGTPTTDKTRKTALKRTCYVILGQGVSGAILETKAGRPAPPPGAEARRGREAAEPGRPQGSGPGRPQGVETQSPQSLRNIVGGNHGDAGR